MTTIDAKRLDYLHPLERDDIHVWLIDEVSRGLADVADGEVKDARSAVSAIKRRRVSVLDSPPEAAVV